MPFSRMSDSVGRLARTRRSGSGPDLTHHERRYQKYADGGIADFLRNELVRKVPIDIDETTLNSSHRNSAVICAVSSRLYPGFPASKACECVHCHTGSKAGSGAFILEMANYAHYLAMVRP